ncbi:MAG: UDP-N-acetylglucosamine 2-epimerase (non-hydrolyzing) [Syntrophorhabdaceae bacterium]|nr:UDP-N-acetylglucosamine 2-epimerase (non-hydrolyzing) [Syntrophorhabdaceae bacterium]
MTMRTVLLAFGTRPEAIKMAPVMKTLEKRAGDFRTIACVTAQHRRMLDQVLSIFSIRPQYDLDIMKENQDLFDITAHALTGLKKVFEETRPDIVLVQGDTTTAFAAGLAAYYLKIPVGHIEAGLRTWDKYSPFPEEVNRRLLSVVADYHFSPTEWSRSNLIQEGTDPERIWVTGNTVIDALMMIKEKQQTEAARTALLDHFKTRWGIEFAEGVRMLLVTGHRRENFGAGFRDICTALKTIARQRPDVTVIYPVHLNPRVQRPVKEILSDVPNIHLIEPVEYEQFIFLMSRSYMILTDSGGVQEEAPSLGKPVLVMREVTERPEGVEAGVVRLVGTDSTKIVASAAELLDNDATYRRMSEAVNPYGDGKASERIVDILSSVVA